MPSGQSEGEQSNSRSSQSFGQKPQHVAKRKSKTGFVGLKNMGCICYMNSTLQQASGGVYVCTKDFHVELFRSFIPLTS